MDCCVVLTCPKGGFKNGMFHGLSGLDGRLHYSMLNSLFHGLSWNGLAASDNSMVMYHGTCTLDLKENPSNQDWVLKPMVTSSNLMGYDFQNDWALTFLTT